MDLGPAKAGAPVAARVYLAGRDPRGLRAYATAVSDPRRAMYRHYLITPQQAPAPAARITTPGLAAQRC